MAERKRGGQPHSLNPLRHGFYARDFTELEIADLETVLCKGLINEISMLRVLARRAFERMGKAETTEDMALALGALGQAVTRLANALRVEKMLGSGSDEVSQAISQALGDVLKEFNYDAKP